ncbi:MAG: hypothetical protein U1E62_14200 [Alsobacter sp.]
MTRLVATTAGLLGLMLSASGPSPASAAGAQAADSCAKGLSTESRMIYDATVRAMKGPSTIRDTVVAQTKALVMEGKIAEANARPAAEAAGACLRLLAGS